jgi:S-sulfo-L-cysteine synthase (O-acetyl-L-serine-dependent)
VKPLRVLDSICGAVGNTPLVRLRTIDRETPGVEIWAKLEFTNPGGSVKDRPALQMLLDAEAAGKLRPGMSIIDSTSGNTGVALALYGAARGYRVNLVMPENVSQVRKDMLQAFGAEIFFSDPMDGSDGAIRLVRELVARSPDRYFYTDQYSNPSNPRAHYLTTAPEIIAEAGDRITHFVAGIGTSGTIMGTGRRLKEHRASIEVIGVEPEDQFHGLEGLKHIATSIVPAIYDPTVLDRTIFMNTELGWNMSDRIVAEAGLLVGHSGGAAAQAALQVAQALCAKNERGLIVAILPDHASRYVEVKHHSPRRSG